MNLIERNKSVLTGKNNLEDLITIKNFPVFFGCVESNPKEDLFADMEWKIDPETGVIQLTKLIPLDILYQAQHVDSVGRIWEEYYSNFSEYIHMCKPSKVLEIGGGSGRLAEKVISKNLNIDWTIVEPNPTYKGNLNIKLIPKFFDENFKIENEYDTIVFSQVLEHAYDPMSFIQNIASFLNIGEKLIFAFPNLELWLKNGYTNSLNFEHTILLSENHVEYILSKYRLKVTDKTIYKDHSIFYTCVKSDNVEIKDIENKYTEYKKLFLEFISSYKKDVKEYNNRLDMRHLRVYLFGAHIFSQYLMMSGFERSKVNCILDNSPLKQGKRLYGTDLFVKSPNYIRGVISPIIILKAGIYNEEIKQDILENINSTVIFWD